MQDNRYLITRYHDGILGLYYQDNKIESISYEKENNDVKLGNIYIARVLNIVPNLNAAFVAINEETKCFLPISESAGALKQNDEIAVQIIKEAVKTKDAVATRNLTLKGEYIVLSLTNTKCGYSNVFTKQLKEKLKEILVANTDYFRSDEKNILHFEAPYGIIFRTKLAEQMCQNIFPEDVIHHLISEIHLLAHKMEEIINHAKTRICYTCLYKTEPAYITEISSELKDNMIIETDDEFIYEEINHKFLAEPNDNQVILKKYEDKDYPMLKLYSVETRIQELLSKKIWLKSGANLYIEVTEAMVVIDVNSAKNIDRNEKDSNILKINMEAAEEIARQIRLRKLSGMIIIDFINMNDKKSYDKLIIKMKECIQKDKIKTEYIDMTGLGLMEITRQKKEKPLQELFSLTK